MKKLLFLFLLATAAWTVQAQTTKHHCSEAATATSSVLVSEDAIAQAASLDETIERRVCETSGKVSYYRKDVCEKSGKVSYEPVSYDASTGQFVNTSPSEVGTSAKSCCASKGAKATAASKNEKSCAGSKAGKSCCAGKSAKSASAAVAPTATKVKNSN